MSSCGNRAHLRGQVFLTQDTPRQPRLSDGTQFTSAWDAAGRLLTTSSGSLTYIYTVYFPNGLRQAFGTYHTATGFGYDAMLRPNAIAHYFANSAADAIWVDTRDPAGGIISTWRDNDAYAWAGHYATNRGYTTNGLNQYTAAGSASFTYDANGNLISDGSNAYVYDIENRLVSVSGGHNATLVYDPAGRLAQVTSGSSTTRFLYDGDALVAEYNSSGAMTERYLHAAGADVPMVTFDGTTLATPHYLLADHQGSIIASADSAGISGTPNTYDEYGIPGAANTGRFQYTGQAWLPELGMYYYKARIYSPTLGRFLQVDPIGYKDQFNLYEYVGDDPINRADPTGLVVTLSGKEEDQRRFMQISRRATGLSLSVRNGRIIAAPARRGAHEGVAARTFRNAINSTATIPIRAVSNAPNMLVDAVLDNDDVDVADLEVMQNRDANLGAAALTHVMSERTDMYQNAHTWPTSHPLALRQEAAVMGHGAVTRTESGQVVGPNLSYRIEYRDAQGNVTQSFPFTNDANGAPQ